MKKTHYLKELKISRTTKLGSKGKNVSKIQEWLNLWRIYEGYDIINVTRDSVFGRETDYAIKQFQEIKRLPANGIVDDYIFSLLSAPILNAYSSIDKTGTDSFKDLIIPYAKQHLKWNPREFKSNLGPWVRSYTNGNQGKQWAWCVGFVTTIMDLACSTHGFKFTDIIPNTLSCDVLGEHSRKNMRLIRNKDIENSLDVIQPGDIFLLHGKNKRDWWHTGIIQEVYDTYFKTIEGNTNDEGSREGFEVCGRVRFHQYMEKREDNIYMDVVRIEDRLVV